MGKHRRSAGRKWGPYVTTGIALEAATLLAFAYATDDHVVTDTMLTASTSIFVDGTKSLTGNEDGVSPYRMVDSLQGKYSQSVPKQNQFVTYPRSLGPITGLSDPTYDASEAEATRKTVQAVRDAKKDPDYHPGDTIYVVGYSQGAGAVAKAIPELETNEFAGDDIQYVLAANPRRNDGGILTRVPAGVYLPVFGVTFGGGTTPQDPNTKVLQVTKQYDGVADSPTYVFNVLADVNAAMGYYYLHPGYYKTVDPSTTPADDRIITKSADGRITDVLIKAPVGQLPLTMPLRQLGVPSSVVDALDPFLRAVIETGYDRPAANDYPSQPVPFQLVPPPSRWLPDVQSVAAGAAASSQALAGTAPVPNPIATPQVTATPGPVTSAARAAAPLTDQPETPKVDPTPDKKPPVLNKFEPPRAPANGWKPGDLLRSILNLRPGATAPADKPSTPAEPSPVTANTGDGATPAGDTAAAPSS